MFFFCPPKDIKTLKVPARARDRRVCLAYDRKGLLSPVFESLQDITSHMIILDDTIVFEPAVASFKLRLYHRDDQRVPVN